MTEARAQTVINQEDSKLIRIAIDSVTVVQISSERSNETISADDRSPAHTTPILDDTIEDVSKVDSDNEIEEYAVSRNLCNVQRPEVMDFVVACYGYRLPDDTVETAVHLHEHFIEHY